MTVYDGMHFSVNSINFVVKLLACKLILHYKNISNHNHLQTVEVRHNNLFHITKFYE